MTKLDRRNSDLRYLRKREGHKYEVVVPVPKALRPAFGGQTRIAKSLGTDNLAEARRQRWPIREELLQAFDSARRERRLSLADMEAACARHYATMFEAALKWTAAARDVAVDTWREDLHGASEARDEDPDGDLMDPEEVLGEIEDIRKRTGCRVDGEDVRTLARGLLRARIAAVLGAEAIKNAVPADPPGLPWIVELTRPGAWNGAGPVGGQGRPIGRRGHDGTPKISEALQSYLKDRQADSRSALSGRFVQEIGTTFRRLQEHLGDVSLGSVTKRDAAGFAEHLLETTARSAATVNKSITAVSGLWKWAIKAGVLDEDAPNPWRGQSRPAPRADRVSWLPYELKEIEAIWSALTNHAPDWRSPGRDQHTVSTSLPWMFATSLLSGLRIEEVGGLRCRDLNEAGGAMVFDVVEHEHRKLKSAAAVRLVPVHPALIEMGLIEFRDTVAAAHGEDALLLPGLSPTGPDRKLSAAASKHFGRIRRSAGVTRDRVSYHSTRSWATTAMERAGVPQATIEFLLGHANGVRGRSESLSRYSSGPAIRQLKDAVESITAPNVLLGTTSEE